MQNQKIILLGGNILNKGIIDNFHQKGFDVIVIDWNENPALKGDLHVKADVKDFNVISSELDKLKINNILCAYTSMDLAVKSVKLLNKKYGLLCTDEHSIKNALSKELMTQLWDKNKLLNRFSKPFTDFNEKEFLELNVQYNLIVKPNVSSSSRGITIIGQNSSSEEIKKAFDKAKGNSFDKAVIVEEFVDGTEYTVEMLGDNCGNVLVYAISTKYHTSNTINNKIAVKLHYNSNKVSDELHENIANFGINCYKALGLKNSFGHLEIIVKKDGSLTPIEIGARSSGYIASHLVDIASDRDYLGDYIAVLKGNCLKNGYVKSDNSSMYFFYDIPAGTIAKKATNLMNFIDKRIVSIDSNRTRLIKSNVFNNINNDNERVGFEILKGEKNILTIEEVLKAEKKFINTIGCTNE